jgi:hypothetical protein
VGGGFPGGARRAIRYGDGWIPIAGRDPVAENLAEFRKLAQQAGRDPDSIEVSLFGLGPDEGAIKAAREAGVSRVVFGLPSAGRDSVLPLLDRYAEAMKNTR